MPNNRKISQHSTHKKSPRIKLPSLSIQGDVSHRSSQDPGDDVIIIVDGLTPADSSPVKTPSKVKLIAKRRLSRLANNRQAHVSKSKWQGHPAKSDAVQSTDTRRPTNLVECHDQADIKALRLFQSQVFLDKALHPLKPKSTGTALGDRHALCHRLISGYATDRPTMLSNQVLIDAYEHTGRGLSAMIRGNPSLEVIFATIVSGDGATSTDAPIINIESEITKAKKFAAKVTPDFIGTVEHVLINNHSDDAGGRTIQVHSHMLLVGENILTKAQVAAKKYGPTLPVNIGNRPQIVVKPVPTNEFNLMKMASYLFKLPYKAKTWCPPRDGKKGHMHHSEKSDRHIVYLRMAMILSMLPLETALFAGGACKAIRSGVIKDARSNCKSNCRQPNRMLAPDTVGSFWVEVSKALNKTKWQLPGIIGSK